MSSCHCTLLHRHKGLHRPYSLYRRNRDPPVQAAGGSRVQAPGRDKAQYAGETLKETLTSGVRHAAVGKPLLSLDRDEDVHAFLFNAAVYLFIAGDKRPVFAAFMAVPIDLHE